MDDEKIIELQSCTLIAVAWLVCRYEMGMSMAEFEKLTYMGNKVEAEMLVERLKSVEIPAYMHEGETARPKLYSGGFAAFKSVDIYVPTSLLDKAKEYLEQWDKLQTNDEELNEEAAGASDIPEDVQEYLKEMEKDHKESVANRLLWGKRIQMIFRVVSWITIVLIIIVIIIALQQ